MLVEKSAMCAFLHPKIFGDDAPIATYFEHSSIIIKHIDRAILRHYYLKRLTFLNSLIDEVISLQAGILNIFLKLSEIANEYKRYDMF